MALPDGLLDAVKAYLDIEGDTQDAEVSQSIQDGIDFVDGLTGMSMDYTVAGKPQKLLFEYCELSLASEFDEDEFKAAHMLDLLLIAVRNYLDITWQDEDTDTKLNGIILRAISTMQSYAGAEIDFETETDEKQLLFDCIRYIYNNAFEHFKVNFADELMMLRAKYQTANIILEADVDE